MFSVQITSGGNGVIKRHNHKGKSQAIANFGSLIVLHIFTSSDLGDLRTLMEVRGHWSLEDAGGERFFQLRFNGRGQSELWKKS